MHVNTEASDVGLWNLLLFCCQQPYVQSPDWTRRDQPLPGSHIRMSFPATFPNRHGFFFRRRLSERWLPETCVWLFFSVSFGFVSVAVVPWRCRHAIPASECDPLINSPASAVWVDTFSTFFPLTSYFPPALSFCHFVQGYYIVPIHCVSPLAHRSLFLINSTNDNNKRLFRHPTTAAI